MGRGVTGSSAAHWSWSADSPRSERGARPATPVPGETWRIVVDTDGISVQRGGQATELGWSDVAHRGFVDGRPPAGRLFAVHPPGIVLDPRQLDRDEAAITSAVREHSAGRFPNPAGGLDR